MSLANFFVQPTPELEWQLTAKVDGTWAATITNINGKAGQRSEYLQVGEIRQELITIQPITNCRVMTISGLWAERGSGSAAGVQAGDGGLGSSSTGASELNETLAGPFAWPTPSTNLFGVNWGVYIEAIADGLVICLVNSNVAQLAPLTIPTRKLNKPSTVGDIVLSSSQMAYVFPDKITRDVGDFTTQVKVRDDVLVHTDSFGNYTGRVKSLTAGELTMYAPHNKDSGGNIAGGLVVTQASDGT